MTLSDKGHTGKHVYTGLAEIGKTKPRWKRLYVRHAKVYKPCLRPREKAILLLLGSGLLIKEAGPTLGITEGTARKYLKNARTRLNCRTTEQLLVKLWQGELSA